MQIRRIRLETFDRMKVWLRAGWRVLLPTLMMAVLPIAAWAQSEEDEQLKIDPATAAQQNRIIGTIIALVIIFVAWYYFRRWQITHRSNRRPDDDKKD